MIVVLDASVAVKWFLPGNPDEQHTEKALQVLEQSVLGLLLMVQPDHFVAEVAAVLARLKPAAYEELGRAHLVAPTNECFGREVVWSHPAFAGRCIFVRNDRELVCVSLAE